MELDSMLGLAKDLGGIFLAVFYVAIVLWTYKDARRRIDDPILVATSVATSMLPIVGVLVYMLLRPPEYLADVRERELEIKAMERTLGRQERCPYCRSHIEGDYLSCPVCMSKLRQACSDCERPLDPRWAMCPFCETEVPRPGGEAGGARPAPRHAAPPRRAPESSSSSRRGSSPATKPASTRAPAKLPAPKSTPKRTSPTDKPSSTDNGSSGGPGAGDIHTEPFQFGASAPRFVRNDQPTMIHTNNPTLGGGTNGDTF